MSGSSKQQKDEGEMMSMALVFNDIGAKKRHHALPCVCRV